MQWQDIVLTLGQLIFIFALIPALKHKHKPPFATSLINTIVLVVFVIVYVTLSLWYAALVTVGLCVLWFILAVQKKRQKN